MNTHHSASLRVVLVAAAIASALAMGAAPASARTIPGINEKPMTAGPARIPPGLHPSQCTGAMMTAMPAQAPTAPVAQAQAISLWTANVTQQVGAPYADWNNAQQKNLACSYDSGTHGQVCIAHGIPCTKAP